MESDDNDSQGDEDEDDGGGDDEDDGGSDDEDDGGGDDENHEESDTDDSEIDDANPLYRKREAKDNIRSMTANNLRSDIEKGNSVRNQQKLYDNCVEVRILLQKCLITSNKMPQFDVYKQYTADEKFSTTTEETQNKLKDLLDNLLIVQERLMKNHPETKNLFDEKSQAKDNKNESDPMNEEIPSDTEDEQDENENENDEDKSDEPPRKKQRKTLKQYENILNENHNKFRSYRNSVIQKWNDKTRIASGKMNKTASQPVVKQIEFLMSDKTKIIRKSQLKRSEYEIIGKKSLAQIDEDGRKIQDYDLEIYDDNDFYHQILKELIEHRSSDLTDPVALSKQWIQLQNMRSKMKKRVDTKATKGRRIRYNVHNKLVNFMAPITYNDTWSDQAKTELYNSLFGKFKVTTEKQSK